MVDPQKLFEILKSEYDLTAKQSLEKIFQDDIDTEELLAAGFKPQQSSSTAYSAYSSGNDSEIKDSSLFYYALIGGKYHSAAYLLSRLGPRILLKSNDKKENGFHAVAKCYDSDFRKWFLLESCVVAMTHLTDEFKKAINQITVGKQHVLTLVFQFKCTVDELTLWLNLGADPSYQGVDPGNYLHFCCDKLRSDLVEFLVKRFPSLMREPNEKGQIPAHIAYSSSDIECLDVLVRQGSPLFAPDKFLNSPIHCAMVRGAYRAAACMLSAQPTVFVNGKWIPTVNMQNALLQSPFHLLILNSKHFDEKSFQSTLELLLAYGADSSLTDATGKNPLQLAASLLASKDLSTEKFTMVWNLFTQRRNPQLITQGQLQQSIRHYYAPAFAEQLISALAPIFPEQLPDPFQQVRQHYLQSLRDLLSVVYPNQPHLAEPFLAMFTSLQTAYEDRLNDPSASKTCGMPGGSVH